MSLPCTFADAASGGSLRAAGGLAKLYAREEALRKAEGVQVQGDRIPGRWGEVGASAIRLFRRRVLPWMQASQTRVGKSYERGIPRTPCRGRGEAAMGSGGGVAGYDAISANAPIQMAMRIPNSIMSLSPYGLSDRPSRYPGQGSSPGPSGD